MPNLAETHSLQQVVPPSTQGTRVQLISESPPRGSTARSARVNGSPPTGDLLYSTELAQSVSNGAFAPTELDDRSFEEHLLRPPECYAVVVWDYLAANEDELSLRKGESVAIHCRDESVIGDVGWWFGKVGNRAGVFPLNYVEAVELPSSPATVERPNLFEIEASDLTKHKLLATGGFGRVYMGSYMHKCEELRLEGELLAQFSHRNIATLHGVTTTPTVALVMEYASGGSVFSALETTLLTPVEVLDWAGQIARGMNYLHNESPVTVVHRDLKSANVLLANAGDDGQVQTVGNVLKITDFGLARKFVGVVNDSGSLGTCQYMAPETIRNGTYSKSSDVWSFGVVLWELLTSQVPYRGLPWGTVMYSIGVRGSALPIPSSCPEPFRDLLVKCAENEPTSRPGFGRIVTILQDIPSSKTYVGKAWTALQVHWKTEMSERFLSLKQSEKVMESQQVELRAIQQRQNQKQKALNEMELALRQRSQELQFRELRLLIDAGKETRPAPVRRRAHRHRGRAPRLSKDDIGTPQGFRHLVHLTNDGGCEQISKKKGKVQSPVLASARALQFESPGTQCRRCFHVTTSLAETECELCHAALPRNSTTSSGMGSPVSPLSDSSERPWQHDGVTKSASVGPVSAEGSPSPTSRRRWLLGHRRGVTSPSRQASADSGVGSHRQGPEVETLEAPLISSQSSQSPFKTRSPTGQRGPPRKLTARAASEVDETDVRTLSPQVHSPWGDPNCADWYKPTMSRTESKGFLLGQPLGTFVVRKSKSQPQSLAISVLQRDNEIWNGIIIPGEGGWRLGMSGPILFLNPSELVKYYCQVPYARDTTGHNCTLYLPGLSDTGPARLRAMSESLLKINPLGRTRGHPNGHS